MNKFLDEDNIIKKEDIVVESDEINDVVDMGFEENDVVEEVKPPKKKRTVQKKKEVQTKEETSVKVREPKSERDVIIDLYDKLREQKLIKEIELDVNHFMYNEGGSNRDREIYQRMIDNLAKEIRTLEKKIYFLQKRM
nr:MAG TPA: hypothetical protein [Caudoviricetes sp.]